MKYPLENATVWDLIRHPFDEESGDPGGRMILNLQKKVYFKPYAKSERNYYTLRTLSSLFLMWNTDDCPVSAFYKIAELLSYTVTYSINSKK